MPWALCPYQTGWSPRGSGIECRLSFGAGRRSCHRALTTPPLKPFSPSTARQPLCSQLVAYFCRFLAIQNIETTCSYVASVDFPGLHGVITRMITPLITSSMRTSNTQCSLKVDCLHSVACTRSGSGFPSNATLFWIFYSIITATCFGRMTIFKWKYGHTTETCSGYWIKY
jgi:hypothetical protein